MSRRLRFIPEGGSLVEVEATEGEPIEGYRFSRTLEYAARQRRETFDRLQYATRETVTLSPLPCWKDLSIDVQRTRALSLIGQIETEAAARRARTGGEPLGVAAILGRIRTIVPGI